MTVVNAAQAATKTVSDPNGDYESLRKVWDKSRAVGFPNAKNKPMNKADYLFKCGEKIVHHSCFKIHKARGNLHILD